MGLNFKILLTISVLGVATLCQGQQSREVFGKNRIQYKQFEWQYITSENFDVYYYDNRRKIATDAIQIFGGYGYTKDFPVEKFYRDAKLCTIGEGTSEIQKIVIAREVLQ